MLLLQQQKQTFRLVVGPYNLQDERVVVFDSCLNQITYGLTYGGVKELPPECAGYSSLHQSLTTLLTSGYT